MSDVVAPGGPSAGKPPDKPKRRSPRKEDWIAHHLKHAYDESLTEAIPASWQEMLDSLDDREPEAGDGEDRG